MPDTNIDVPENVALADESIAMPVLMSPLNGLDPHVEKSHNVTSGIISCGMLLAVFFTQNVFICPFLIRYFFNIPKSMQLLIQVFTMANEEAFPRSSFRRC
jgi:hypothetical protein